MSINVNVTGNPVRINRGTLISGDPDYDKKEFDKRRRMRLEQVRHQSKDIAENVRNKVRKEKEKQLSDFEKREEGRLKKWQNRKLLELQQQYCESLKDIGLGHAQAFTESTQDDIEEDYREKQMDKAKERGQRAIQKLQAEKNKQNLQKAIPLQHKKLTRAVENARAAMVSKNRNTPTKKRKKRKPKTNINITTNLSSDSHSESEIEELDIMSDDCDCSLTEAAGSGARRRRSKSPTPSPVSTRYDESPVSSPTRKAGRKSRSRAGSPKRPKSPTPTITEPRDIEEYPVDTRISDRIKHRRYLLHPLEEVCQPCHQRKLDKGNIIIQNQQQRHVDKTTSMTGCHKKPESIGSCECKCPYCNHVIESKQDKNEIPVKPTVSLKDIGPCTKKSDDSACKVQYYDHNNRFSKEYVEKRPSVKKISDESIQIRLSPSNEQEYAERMFKNDKEAEVRGRKALEKVNVQKDYQQMLKQLPVLQKQERIATLSNDKQTHHMDSDRLQEYERNKQNRMENVYDRHFPKTITIPPKNHIIEDQPFKTIDVSESNPVLNVAEWDVDEKNGKGFTLTKDCGNIVIETDASTTNKEDYLKYLLERLKLQKEMLLREAAALPQNSNLNSIINDLENLQGKERLSPRNFGAYDECPCPIPGETEAQTSKLDDKKSMTHKRMRESVVSTSTSSTSSTPPKKRKHKKYKIILQNTSTQTSPKTVVCSKANVGNLPSHEDISLGDDERPRKKHSSRKISPRSPSSRRDSPRRQRVKCACPAKSESTLKVCRPASPARSIMQGKDQASSPIILDQVKRVRSKSPLKDKSSKCKCKSVEGPKKSCKCKKEENRDEVCEILIKIKDNDQPEIRIKSPIKQLKNVTVKDLTGKSGKTVVEKESMVEEEKSNFKLRSKRVVKINDKASEKMATSWKDQLSRNEIAGTSTSTSYFSPPDFSRSDFSRGPQAESTGTRPSCYSSETTGKSSQGRKKIDPKLLKYIKKLLTMSRYSIEDLGVSSVSDVSTPSINTFDNTKNSSLNQLRNVIKYFNINPEDLAYYLNYSDDTPATSGSAVDRNFSTPSTGHSSGYDASKSRLNDNNASTSLSDRSKTRDSVKSTSQSVPTPLTHYADLAELCEKRISDLADMIKKVRMEKQQILSPVQSDKENSTQYMGLPSQLRSKTPDTTSDVEQAEINRKMLEIDYGLAEHLRVAAQERMLQEDAPCEMNELEKELVERYRRLVNVHERVFEDDEKTQKTTSIREVEVDDIRLNVQETRNYESLASTSDEIHFTPLLVDIPRLPKLESIRKTVHSPNPDNEIGKHKKPPPAKGLIVAKKFNIDITNVPHELSTIVEVDSQLSTRIRRSCSPKRQSRKCSPIGTFDHLNPVIVLPEFPTDWIEKKEAEEKRQSEGSMPDIVAEIAVNTDDVLKRDKAVQIRENPSVIPENKTKTPPEHSTESSTEEKSEVDNIESMLKSMGMGWAIATLKKTKEAQNRASSSTSVDTTSKEQQSSSSVEENSKPLTNSSSTSDITLRDILGKKLFANSTATSQSISPHLGKTLNELSAIEGLGSGRSTDTKHQRTSTPVQTTKSSESKKGGIFTAESEVSSVKLSDGYLTLKDTTGNSSDV